MMQNQSERVPKGFQLADQGSSNRISVALESPADVFLSEPCRFYFEALRPNVFRTTFTSASHPAPPYPSAHRPEPDFSRAKKKDTLDGQSRKVEFVNGATKALVEWESGPPTVSLYYEGDRGDGTWDLIHRDLQYRSYAVDGDGVSHYTVYNKDTLHVGLGEKAAPMDLSGRGFQITASDTFGYDAYRTDPLYKHIPLLINATPKGCVAIFSTSHARASWAVGSEIDGLWGRYKVYRQAHGGLEEYLITGRALADVVRTYAELVGFPLPVPRYVSLLGITFYPLYPVSGAQFFVNRVL